MNEYDLIVIGGGPAGYTGAIRAAQLGMKVACVEGRGALGGTCLNVGCIPSKALLQSSELFFQSKHELSHFGINLKEVGFDLGIMQQRKEKIVSTMNKGIEGLLKKNKIDYINGYAKFEKPGIIGVKSEKGVQEFIGKNILIATGSEPIELPFAKFDEEFIVSSTGALLFKSVPEHLVVIGGGVIGLELGSVWARLGAKVTVIEATSSILPSMDPDILRVMNREFKKLGFDIHLGARFLGYSKVGEKIVVKYENESGVLELNCNRVLVAVGRRAFTKDLGLENIGIVPEKNGKIKVGNNFQTSAANVYAVGDVIHGPMLAHKAEEDAVACVETLCGGHRHIDYNLIPNVVYTWPEIATVGKTEAECLAEGLAIKVGKFPFSANGRAKANGFAEGFVKVVATADSARILGVHIVGPHASELIASSVLAMEYKASPEDVARTCHAHPTLSEAIKEACLGVDGISINF